MSDSESKIWQGTVPSFSAISYCGGHHNRPYKAMPSESIMLSFSTVYAHPHC